MQSKQVRQPRKFIQLPINDKLVDEDDLYLQDCNTRSRLAEARADAGYLRLRLGLGWGCLELYHGPGFFLKGGGGGGGRIFPAQTHNSK